MDSQYCSDMVMYRVDKTIQLMEAVKKLKDPQSELLLLRNCTGVSRLYFTLRTTKPQVLEAATSHFDQHLFQYLRLLITGDGAGFGPLQQRITTLPIKDGGLGVYIMEDTGQFGYLASCIKTQSIHDIILRYVDTTTPSPNFQFALDKYVQVCGLTPTFTINNTAPHPMKTLAARYFDVIKRELPTKFTMSERDAVLWQSNKLKHAMDYLKAVPIAGLNHTIGPRHFRVITR